MSVTLSSEIRDIVKHLHYDKEYSYEVFDRYSFNRSSLRTTLSRLVEEGMICRTRDAHFKRTELLNELVFVYGSLKKHCSNHDKLKDVKYRGSYETVRRFTMFTDEFAAFPYLVDDHTSYEKKIKGELYEIRKKESLDALDEFEGAPDFFYRKKIMVKSRNTTHKAWVYMYKEKVSQAELASKTLLSEWTENISNITKQLRTLHA